MERFFNAAGSVQRIALHFFVLTIFLILASCTKVDFKTLETGKPYVGLCQGKDCVLVLDQVDEGNVKGRAYFDDGNLLVAPISLVSDVKHNGKGKLYCGSSEMKLKVSLKNGFLKGDAGEKSFSFQLLESSLELPFRAD